jgi:DNA processing protein
MARRLRFPTLTDALVALNAAPMGRASICRLGLEVEAWVGAGDADGARLAASLGVPAKALGCARTAVQAAATVAAAERAAAAALGAQILTHLDADYPAPLRQLALPPPVLYRRGILPPALLSGEGPAAAIVGSRHPSTYGREAAWLFARDLARAGVAVVSGFARGVDAAAHRGALAGGGTTVAVLGCGVDVAYPREHHRRSGGLADEVAAQGALLSELPLGAPPLKGHFPIRNRLIAALTQATLVVEAAVRSGSLITARCALELGREVLALPGRVFDDNAMGPNALLADGARPALHPRDVLAALQLDAPEPTPDVPPPLPGLGARLWEALPPGATRGAEELAARCAAPIDATLAELLELELAGWIARLPGPLYCRRA